MFGNNHKTRQTEKIKFFVKVANREKDDISEKNEVKYKPIFYF